MRTTCFSLVLIAGLSMPAAAIARDNTVVGVGTGAVAGALVGGPIGAVVGAVAGGFIGANSRSARGPRSRRVRGASQTRVASRPGPARARVADGAPPRAVAAEGASSLRGPASEIDTRPSPAATGGIDPAARPGWRDPK